MDEIPVQKRTAHSLKVGVINTWPSPSPKNQSPLKFFYWKLKLAHRYLTSFRLSYGENICPPRFPSLSPLMLLLISQSYSMHLCLSPTLSSPYKGPVFNLSPPNSSFYLQLTIRHALSLLQ